MKVVTWNVNSIRTRLPRVLAFLARHRPDVVCLQETKVPDDAFPREAIAEVGYRSEPCGQGGGYNGVALLARHEIEAAEKSFDGNPIPEQARVISARVAGVEIVNAYVVNGQSVTSDKYELKLSWLDSFRRWIAAKYDAGQPLLVVGDFNIAPADADIYNPKVWAGKVLCTDAERQRLRALIEWGMRDLLRENEASEGIYSWWDYRFGAFRRNHGLRIDLILGTASMSARCASVVVDRDERDPQGGEGKPSDHAPVIATFEAERTE